MKKFEITEQLVSQIFEYLIQNAANITHIHFYGIGMKVIRRYLPTLLEHCSNISIDSTKWTKAVNDKLKKANGVCCRKNTRDLFFNTYIDHIRKFISNVKS